MSYYVEPNNWTKHIPNTITSDNGSYLLPISVDQEDPAVGCLKEFTQISKYLSVFKGSCLGGVHGGPSAACGPPAAPPQRAVPDQKK